MLADVEKFLKPRKIKHEIIVSNDGSKDQTTTVALKEADKLGLNLVVI